MWHNYIIFNVKNYLGSSSYPSSHQLKPKILQQQMLTPTAGKISEKSHEVEVREKFLFLQKVGMNIVYFQ